MLNKNNFFIIIGALVLILLITFKWYKSNENRAFKEAQKIAFIKSKIEYINYLNSIFKTPNLNKLCKKNNKGDVIIYKCKNLTKNNFQTIQDAVFNQLVDIKSFNIDSNGKKIDFTMEIYKQ